MSKNIKQVSGKKSYVKSSKLNEAIVTHLRHEMHEAPAGISRQTLPQQKQ